MIDTRQLLADDARTIWHPYSATHSDIPVFAVESACGVELLLTDGRCLIDGMASWWCAIHGYNVSELNQAANTQLEKMAHVMFGGLTHEPAVALGKKLVEITPPGLDTVFLADSGSVSVEIALKMAVQYWQAKGRSQKQRFVSLRGGYHGDTLGAMSVCDPVTGMHSLFSDILIKNFFTEKPACTFDESCSDTQIADLTAILQENHQDIAALILEPVVQGAGGMHFYSPDYLRRAHALCKQHDVLLITDEIATGFGRSGRLFACEHAGITPDIMCVGKSLTGGYMSLAATLCHSEISDTISNNPPHAFMHGPTFMGNPLACAVALKSIELLEKSPWQQRVSAIEKQLRDELDPCRALEDVADVRVLGAIGVVELKQPVKMPAIMQAFVDAGVWVRPFGKLVYLMPPYIIRPGELKALTDAIYQVLINGKYL